MRLTITNFRCYSNLSVSFEPNQIILVTGKSGSGKTTIFDAIYWCLYKKTPDDKSLRIAPLSGKHLKTTVKLEINDITITRTTKPATLTINCNDGTIADSSAQAYINELYGSPDYWLATSYITQDGRNPLFSGSQVVKTELIRRLCLDKDDPEVFIAKGKEKLKKLEGIYEANSLRFNDDVENIRKSMEQLNITDDHIKNPPTINSLRLPELVANVEALQVQRASLITKRDRRQKLANSIQEWKDRDCHSYIREMELIPTQWEQYDAYINQKTYRDHLNGEIEAIEKELSLIPSGIIPTDGVTYSSEQILIARQTEHLRQQNIKMSEQASIPYDYQSIENAQRELNDTISTAQLALKSNQERQRVLDQINRLTLRITEQERKIKPEVDLSPLMVDCDNLKDQIARLQNDRAENKAKLDQLTSKKPVKCPHCSKSVYIQQQRLEKFPDVSPDEITQLRTKVVEFNSSIAQLEESLINIQRTIDQHHKNRKASDMASYAIETLKSERDSLIVPDLVINEYLDKIDELKSRQKLLSRIEYIELPSPSSQEMENNNHSINLYRLTDKLSTLNLKIGEIVTNHVEKPKMGKLEANRAIVRANWVIQVKEELSGLQENFEELINDVDREIDQLREMIKVENELKMRYDSIMELKKRCDDLSIQKKRIEDEWKEVDSCARLLDYMIEAEHRVYQYTCDIINYHLSTIMRDLIPTVSMEVRTTKVASNKREKPTINLHGTKNGVDVNLADLSGGEKDRCSMALTIALMKLSKSPVIILDETLSSLSDDEDREIAIRILEQHGRSPDHITFCVVHDGTTGWYDQLYACSHNSST